MKIQILIILLLFGLMVTGCSLLRLSPEDAEKIEDVVDIILKGNDKKTPGTTSGAVLNLREFSYPKGQLTSPVKSILLKGLNTNNFFIEFEVENLPFSGKGRVFIPLMTITNQDMVGKIRDPRLNGGRMVITIFGAPAEWRAGIVNLFWSSDNNKSLDVIRGDGTEFEEWRTKTSYDWTKKHKIRIEFRSAGADRLTATLFVDDRQLSQRTAGYYCPNPVLVFSGHYFRAENWLNPDGATIRNLVVDNF